MRTCSYTDSDLTNVFVFSEVVTVMISWQQNFVSSNYVCNHTRD